MDTVEVRRLIAAPATVVFDWISNAENYAAAPLFLAARLMQPGYDAPNGTDAIRRFVFPFGIVQERITHFDPPRSFQYRVIKSVPPVRHEGGSVVLVPKSEGTELIWGSTAELRLPILARQTSRMVFPPLFRRAFTQVVDAAQAAVATTSGDRR